MGFIEKIAGFFTKVGSLPGDALKVLETAWNAIKTVWSFITQSYGALGSAWNWVVNGADWLFGQVGNWAGEVFSTIWQTLTQTIPKAIAWVFDQAVQWAARVVKKVYDELRAIITSVYKFLVKLIHDLVNAVSALIHKFIKWSTDAIRWVLHWGGWIINLLTHPEHIAKWIAGAIIEPVVEWLLKAGVHVIVWLLRKMVHDSTEFAHLIEDVLHDIL